MGRPRLKPRLGCSPPTRRAIAAISTRSTPDARIRALRPTKPRVDPWKAHGALVEQERSPAGGIERAVTVFLAGAECPFTCSFCDLWRYTLDGPTPAGALPIQLARALEEIEPPLPTRLKLYNASNFFDRRAVPPEDLPRIAELAGLRLSPCAAAMANWSDCRHSATSYHPRWHNWSPHSGHATGSNRLW